MGSFRKVNIIHTYSYYMYLTAALEILLTEDKCNEFSFALPA